MKRVLIALIVFYQSFISPLKKPTCRFYPTCSAYSLTLFRLTHPLIALFFSIIRVLKCNPWSKGGYDHPFVRVKISKLEHSPMCCVCWLVPTQKIRVPVFVSRPIKLWAYILWIKDEENAK